MAKTTKWETKGKGFTLNKKIQRITLLPRNIGIKTEGKKREKNHEGTEDSGPKKSDNEKIS